MNKITLKTGEIIEFTKLTYNEENLSKTNLTVNGINSESIWIVLSDEDKKDMDNNKKDGYFVAMLANNALNFLPNTSWGLHIVCRHNGSSTCISDREWVDYNIKENQYLSNE